MSEPFLSDGILPRVGEVGRLTALHDRMLSSGVPLPAIAAAACRPSNFALQHEIAAARRPASGEQS